MNIKFRLTLMSFLQFFIWGSWLITIGAYWFQTLPKLYPITDAATGQTAWTGSAFGAIFSTMGIASLFMPTIAGYLADKFINVEKLYGILHILGGIVLFFIPKVSEPGTFFWVILLNMLFYMPTIALSNAVAYSLLKKGGADVVKDFPPIRVWGTIGFIVALWVVSLLHFETSANQFYVASIAAILLGVYSFTLPPSPPAAKTPRVGENTQSSLNLNAFSLFRNYKMAMFFVFAMLLGAALQLTNAYGDTFLHDFADVPKYSDSIAVKYPAIIMSISQISETLFILAIPFFLRRFGIKQVMLISMVAWVLRFGLFAYGNPAEGLWMIILSCIVYGMAFDFFNISGSLFVETETSPTIRASAQGLFMMMTNGVGAVLGSLISGFVIQHYFTDATGTKNWHGIWVSFASYAGVVAILFVFLFKHKHKADVASNELNGAEQLKMSQH
ncbi:MAG: MFS transporter [Chitinophagaceae bacterium]